MATLPEEARLSRPRGTHAVRVSPSAFTSGPVGASGPGEGALHSGPVAIWIAGAFVDDPQEGRTERGLQRGGWGHTPNQQTCRTGEVGEETEGKRRKVCFPRNSRRRFGKDAYQGCDRKSGRTGGEEGPGFGTEDAVTVGRALQAAVWTERGRRGPCGRRGARGGGRRGKEWSPERRSRGLSWKRRETLERSRNRGP